ncbi:MAG: hypothetical protein LBG80_01395 [Bacteroidales bacterium]|nr:hypothetical protein [Bacteroidales bacterium]
MENVLKINAGIACSDRANKVEPRPNEEMKLCVFGQTLHKILFIQIV